MDPLYTLVAAGDDSSRDHLAGLLAPLPDLAVVETSTTALGVLRALRSRRIDLVLLDAALPPDGAQAALERMSGDAPPAVIVTGAAPGDGLWAYALGATDCLAHPIMPARLRLAVARARDRTVDAEVRTHCAELLALLSGTALRVPASESPARPLVVRSGSQLLFIDPAEIDWVQASGVYVCIHIGSTVHLVRETLRHVEEQLDAAQFVRIHRSTLLNVGRVRKIVPHLNGGAVVILKDGAQMKMSRSYREQIHASIG